MDIKKYLDLQQKRNLFRTALNANLRQDAVTIVKKYEKVMLQEVAKNIDDNTFTGFSLKPIIEDFSSDLLSNIEVKTETTVDNLTKLWEEAKATLDAKYPTEFETLPEAHVDNYQILREADAILTKYRNGEITELRMKRLLSARLGVPAHAASTFANTQVAGFDNLASKAVADLAFLNKAIYFGPATDPELSHDLCIQLTRANLIYTEDQIKRMSNKQGLPVLIYCGGFNCVHEWVWVNEAWVELKAYKLAA